jgi:hypothetical protein
MEWDKRGDIEVGVGEVYLGGIVPSVKPVRSHAGVNVAGPSTCDSNGGGQHKKVDELRVIIREERRVEREDATHFRWYTCCTASRK